MVAKVLLCVLKDVRRVEERLGRDAADVQAGPAERAAGLDARDLEAELTGLDRCNVATGPASDDDNVVLAWGAQRGGRGSRGRGFSDDGMEAYPQAQRTWRERRPIGQHGGTGARAFSASRVKLLPQICPVQVHCDPHRLMCRISGRSAVFA